mgnify:CR=1 FL=1
MRMAGDCLGSESRGTGRGARPTASLTSCTGAARFGVEECGVLAAKHAGTNPDEALQATAKSGPRLSAQVVQPAADGRLNARRLSRAGCSRLRRPNQRLEPMALRATAQAPPVRGAGGSAKAIR